MHFLTGSYARSTMISPLSEADIDVFVCLDPSYFHRFNNANGGPAGLLNLARQTIKQTYTSTPDISRNGQAVTIRFSDFVVDVVVGFHRNTLNAAKFSKPSQSGSNSFPTISHPMADASTGDRPPSKQRDNVILEAQRLEERTRDSMKGHHCAAEGWEKRGVNLGIPTAIISGITSLAVFAQAARDTWWVGAIAALLSVIVTALTTVTTVLKPTEKQNAHLTAANAYDRLNNDARIFWSIECWNPNATDELLTAKLLELVDRKDKLNSDSPQIPPWARKMAEERIARGETDYTVDLNRTPAKSAITPATQPAALPPPALHDAVAADAASSGQPAG